MKFTKFIDNNKISRTTINTIFEYTNTFLTQEGTNKHCIGKVLCNAFFKPNYENDLQFEIAMNKLGGKVIQVDKDKCFNNDIETFEDSIKRISNYCDIIVLSYDSFQSIKNVSKKINACIINSGCDKTKDMVQPLVDLFTLYKNFDIENESLKILFVGDLYNDDIQSFKKILALYSNIHISHVEQWNNINEGIFDVIYYCQPVPSKETIVTINEIDKNLDKKTIIMHPNNNNIEIYNTIDKTPCSVFSMQDKFGIYVRMSIIYTVLFNLLDNNYDTLEYNYLSQLQSEIHHW